MKVSIAVAVSGYVFLKYNKFAVPTVKTADEDRVVNTLLSKIGNDSIGGLYDAIIIK